MGYMGRKIIWGLDYPTPYFSKWVLIELFEEGNKLLVLSYW